MHSHLNVKFCTVANGICVSSAWNLFCHFSGSLKNGMATTFTAHPVCPCLKYICAQKTPARQISILRRVPKIAKIDY